MNTEVAIKNTIDLLPVAEQTRIVGNALYRGAQWVGIKRPATAEETRKEYTPIIREVLKSFANIFEADDFANAFRAAANHATAVGKEHYGVMSLEYAVAVFSAWRREKWNVLANSQKTREKMSDADYNRWWEADRLRQLTRVYDAIKDNEPISINPETMLATHIEGRLESLGIPCRRDERWKQPRILTELIQKKGLTLAEFLGNLAKPSGRKSGAAR